MILYTGTVVWEGKPIIRESRKERVAHGPGLYFTTSLETARKYAGGPRTVLRVEVDEPRIWLEDAIAPTDDLIDWVNARAGMRKKREIVADILRNAKRTEPLIGAGMSRVSALVNLMVNHEAITGSHGPALAEFLVSLGIGASHVKQANGEEWVVLFDPSLVRGWRKVNDADPWLLPSVRRNKATVEEGFTLDPSPWVETISVDGYGDVDGFFHVTTRRDAVLSSGRLLSRRRSGTVGLGGGPRNEAPDTVSFVWDLARAQWLCGAMCAIASAAAGKMTASELILRASEWTGFPGDYAYRDNLERRGDPEDLDPSLYQDMNHLLGAIFGDTDIPVDPEIDILFGNEWTKYIKRHAALIDEAHDNFDSMYEMVQLFEAHLQERFIDRSDEDYCQPIVGFTAPAYRMQELREDQIAIVQAAVRLGARDEIVPTECELRFSPDDVQLIGLVDQEGHT